MNINKIKRITLVGFILLTIGEIYSQSPSEDSLKAILIADSLKKVGFNFYKSGQIDSSLVCIQEAVDIYLNQGSWNKGINGMTSLSSLHYFNGNFKAFRALQDSSEQLAHQKLPPNHKIFLSILINKCVSLRSKGDYHGSIEYGLRAIQIQDKEDPKLIKQKSSAYQQLSYSFREIGEYSKAIEYAKVAIQLGEKVYEKGAYKFASLHHALAIAYQKNQSFESAIHHFNRAEKIYQNNLAKSTALNGSLRNLIQIGQTYLEMKDFDSMKIVLYNLKLNKEKLSQSQLSDYYGLLVEYRMEKGNEEYDEMISIIEESTMILVKTFETGSLRKFSNNLDLLAKISTRAGNTKKAEEYYLKTLDSLNASKFLDQPLKIKHKLSTLRVLEGLMDCAEINHDEKEFSIRAYQARNLIRVLNKESTDSDHTLFWAKHYLRIFEKSITSLIRQNELDKAFVFLEENKSNLLTKSIVETQAKGFSGIDSKLLTEEKNIRIDLNEMNSMVNSEKDGIKLARMIKKKLEIETELQELLNTQEVDYPNYYKLKYVESDFTIDQVRNLIDEKTAFIEYFVGLEKAYVFVITKTDILVHEIDEFAKAESVFLDFYNCNSNKSTLNTDSCQTATARAYKILIEDIDKKILKPNNITNLVIVPDDILNNLPFEMLGTKAGQYLGFDYIVQYQYSGRLWKLLQERKHKNFDLDFAGYAYADNSSLRNENKNGNQDLLNLQCGEKEVNTIVEMLELDHLNAINSKKDDFLNVASNSKVVHIASHAFVDRYNPDFSKIYLDTGFVSNLDIQISNLSAEMVVLSACETGFGKVAQGEGSMTLAKSFFQAGCNSALVSLWPVDDCTTFSLMQSFYQNLKEGQAKDLALQNAKKHYASTANPLRAHPYYWSGFVLIGDNAPLFYPRSLSLLSLMSLFILFAILYLLGTKIIK